MNIVREWQRKLSNINTSIEDYKAIYKQMEGDNATYNMKLRCLADIKSKKKYRDLIEETLRRLKDEI